MNDNIVSCANRSMHPLNHEFCLTYVYMCAAHETKWKKIKRKNETTNTLPPSFVLNLLNINIISIWRVEFHQNNLHVCSSIVLSICFSLTSIFWQLTTDELRMTYTYTSATLFTTHSEYICFKTEFYRLCLLLINTSAARRRVKKRAKTNKWSNSDLPHFDMRVCVCVCVQAVPFYSALQRFFITWISIVVIPMTL